MAQIEVKIYPVEDDLLFLQPQHKHRSVAVFEGNPDEELNVRRRDKGLFDCLRDQSPPPGVWQHLQNAGFAGVLQCGWRRFDHGLLTALVERWRPETHTFHFPIGEATITLQDVQVLWGLPVNGPAVTGKWETRSLTDWVTICVDYLGFLPEARRVRGGSVDISYLVGVLEQQPVDVNNPLSLEKRARLYILALLGGCLFSDSSARGVSLNYVSHIMDLSVAGRKSWGSATLAHLFRQLCKAACKKGEHTIAGPLQLLIVWAWERMIDIAPRNRNVTYDYDKPYAARWYGPDAHLSYTDTPQNAVRIFRCFLTGMESNRFNWMPYVGVIHRLPEDCRRDKAIWTYMGWLICWHVVEPHLPNRVKRQFGWTQDIPSRNHVFDDCKSHEDHHNLSRTGRHDTNWEIEHHSYIQVWNNRGNFVIRGQGPFGIDIYYYRWYLRHTIISFDNIGRNDLPTSSKTPNLGAHILVRDEYIRGVRELASDVSQSQPEEQASRKRGKEADSVINSTEPMADLVHKRASKETYDGSAKKSTNATEGKESDSTTSGPFALSDKDVPSYLSQQMFFPGASTLAMKERVGQMGLSGLEGMPNESMRALELDNSELKKQLNELVLRDKRHYEKISVLEREVADLKSLDDQMKLTFEARSADAERRATEAEKRLAESKRNMEAETFKLKKQLDEYVLCDQGYKEKIRTLEREVADLKSLNEQTKLSLGEWAVDAERRASEAEKRLSEAKRKMVEAEGTMKAAFTSFAL